MKFLPVLQAVLFAVGKQEPSTTWIIDGNNLLAHKGTPIDRGVLAQKLEPIRADSVVLVFDGRPGEPANTETEGTLKTVTLAESVSADDFIVQEIQAMMNSIPKRRVQVVTADRQLRRLVLENKPVVRGVVNPVTFWKRYLPRLCGLKLRDPVESEVVV